MKPIALVALAGLTSRTLAAPAPAPAPAEQLYTQGKRAFDAGDFAAAAAAWKRSYDLSREPELLFDIGLALRKDHDCAHALSAFRTFLAASTASARRQDAAKFVGELADECDVPPPESPHASRSARTRLAAAITMGGGAVLVLTGLAFGGAASSLADQVTIHCNLACDWATEKSADERGHRDATLEWVFVGAGLGALATGAALYYLGARDDRTAPVAIVPMRNGAAVAWSRRW